MTTKIDGSIVTWFDKASAPSTIEMSEEQFLELFSEVPVLLVHGETDQLLATGPSEEAIGSEIAERRKTETLPDDLTYKVGRVNFGEENCLTRG